MPPQATDQHSTSLTDLCADLAENSHVIVASNRGPIGHADQSDDSNAARTDNGLAAGSLAPLRDLLPLTWISAAASSASRAAVSGADNGLITGGLPAGWAARLVSPSRRSYHRFYNTICNPLLWFLHHRSWGFTHTPNIDHEAHVAWEQGFVAVSRLFAEEIAAEAKRVVATGNRPVAVLLRDYHMHLVGGMARELMPDVAIHYWVDVPWPGPADWMMLPERWRSSIFRSLLACDVVGFASPGDVRSFLAGVEEFVGVASVDHSSDRVTAEDGHEMHAYSYPPAVDHATLLAAAGSRRTGAQEQRLNDPDRHTFVTADRAEPHKNIVRSVRAFGAMMDRDRSLASTTRYLLTLAPPPPHLNQYRRYMSEIEQAVAEVNRKHRDKGEGPIMLTVENNYPLALAAMRVANTLVAVPIADASCSTALATSLINRNGCSLILSETSSALASSLAAFAMPARSCARWLARIATDR